MRIPFSKYHGSGNDFILVDGRLLPADPSQDVIARWCDRHFGIGADGLIIVRPADQEDLDYIMVYFNADGGLASMCGNGARCAFVFARSIGLCRDEATFEAYDGLHSASFSNGEVTISMRDVSEVETKPSEVFVLDTGSPHYVHFVKDVEAIDVFNEGRAIRNSPAYAAKGINVNFAEEEDHSIRMRTYERGVEDITLSCGTGVTATALAYAKRKGLSKGPLNIQTDGGQLSVDFEKTEKGYMNIRLTGPVQFVFSGEIEFELR